LRLSPAASHIPEAIESSAFTAAAVCWPSGGRLAPPAADLCFVANAIASLELSGRLDSVECDRTAASPGTAPSGRKHKRGRASLDECRRREAGVRLVEHPLVEAGVPALVRDALVADSRAHVTAAQTDAMPMQRFAASACRGPALTRPDLGRLHSSATGVAEPDPDASYVANAIVRRAPAGRGKAIVRTAAAARSRLGESDRAPQRRSGWILASALSPRQSSAARRRDGKSDRADRDSGTLEIGR
jgi:hypothetical protein